MADQKWVEVESSPRGISCPKCNWFNWIDERWVTSSNHLMCIRGCGEIAKVSGHITHVLKVKEQ